MNYSTLTLEQIVAHAPHLIDQIREREGFDEVTESGSGLLREAYSLLSKQPEAFLKKLIKIMGENSASPVMIPGKDGKALPLVKEQFLESIKGGA